MGQGKIVVELKAAYKSKQKVGSIGKKMPPPAERRAAWDSDKFRNLSPEVQGAIREGIDD